MTDLESRIATSLDRLAAEYRESQGDVTDVSRRAMRQSRARAVGAGLAVVAVAIGVGLVVNRTSEDASIDVGTSATTATSLPNDPLLLWPAELPDGSVLVGASREVIPGDDPSSHMGLLVHRDEFGQYIPYWLHAVDPEVKDPAGTPVALADGRSASYLPGTLIVLTSSSWIVIDATVDQTGLIAAAEVLQVDAAGAVGLVPGAPPEWQLVASFRQSERVETRLVFELGALRFGVTVSSAMPEIGQTVTMEAEQLILEPTPRGDVWHLEDLSLMHRTDGTWSLAGTTVEPGISAADRSRILESLRPATADEVAQIEAAIQTSAAQRLPVCREPRALSAEGRYVIQSGDYLNLIASCFGVSLEALMEANPDLRVLVPGAELVVPTTVPSGQ